MPTLPRNSAAGKLEFAGRPATSRAARDTESGLFRRYFTKFNEQEDNFRRVRGQIAKETAGREGLNTYLQEPELT